jgi:hypothetical protein
MAGKPQLTDVTAANAASLPCCGISDPKHPGRAAKLRWLKQNLKLGLRAKVLIGIDGKACGYIEYIPGEHAWRGVSAAGYMFIHCIWNHSRVGRGLGWATAMIDACVKDAKQAGMSGVAVVTRDGPWMADRRLFLANGFEKVDEAPPDFELLVRKFKARAADPQFPGGYEERLTKYRKGLTIVECGQCPYNAKFAGEIAEAAATNYGIKARRVTLRSPRDAQSATSPFAVFSVILDGRALTDHQISCTRFNNIMRGASRIGRRR